MPTDLSLTKTAARKKLRAMAPVRLQRPVFFVPGWTDQGALCWTEPYTEGGVARRPGWEYTMADWVEKIVDTQDRSKAHLMPLVEDERHLCVQRFARGSRQGKVKHVMWDDDGTFAYTNFFQFAELLKRIIRTTGAQQYDLVAHSMGGLDCIAATVLDVEQDPEPEVQRYITSPPLDGVRHLITVATPFRGSPGAKMVKYTKLDEWFLTSWSKGIRQQAEAMAPDSPYIQAITRPERQARLLRQVSGQVHTFGSRNDLATPNKARMIDGAVNHPAADVALARHAQIMGIPQDPRLALAVFRILAG